VRSILSRRGTSETADHVNVRAENFFLPLLSRSFPALRNFTRSFPLLFWEENRIVSLSLSLSLSLGSESVAAILPHARMTIIETVSTIERVSDPLSVGARPASALHIYQLENGFMRIVSSYVLPIDTYVFHYSTSQARQARSFVRRREICHR